MHLSNWVISQTLFLTHCKSNITQTYVVYGTSNTKDKIINIYYYYILEIKYTSYFFTKKRWLNHIIWIFTAVIFVWRTCFKGILNYFRVITVFVLNAWLCWSNRDKSNAQLVESKLAYPKVKSRNYSQISCYRNLRNMLII